MHPEIVQQWRGAQVILTDGQLNHRAAAIQTVCDLESQLSELLSAVFISRNPSVSHEQATKELYTDERVLSSLRKMADVAFFLGVIDQEQRFDLKPERLIGDTAYGAADFVGWMVNEKAIEPHVPLWDRTQRSDGTLSSSEFRWDEQANEYRCPQGQPLRSEWRIFKRPRTRITSRQASPINE